MTDLRADHPRAEVPNPNGLLLPGMYVRVRRAQAQLASGILRRNRPSRARPGRHVLVVGPDNQPAPRPIKIGSSQGNQWLVTEACSREKVIVDGFQKMMVPAPR